MKRSVISVGLKILITVASSVAVVIGCEKAMNKKQQAPQQPQGGLPNVGGGNINPIPPMNNNMNGAREETTGEVVLNTIRASQDTCSKVSMVMQSLSNMTQSLIYLFGNDSNSYNGGGGYYQNNNCAVSPYGNLSRVNNYVVQAGPRNNQYCPYQANVYNGNGNNYPI